MSDLTRTVLGLAGLSCGYAFAAYIDKDWGMVIALITATVMFN